MSWPVQRTQQQTPRNTTVDTSTRKYTPQLQHTIPCHTSQSVHACVCCVYLFSSHEHGSPMLQRQDGGDGQRSVWHTTHHIELTSRHSGPHLIRHSLRTQQTPHDSIISISIDQDKRRSDSAYAGAHAYVHDDTHVHASSMPMHSPACMRTCLYLQHSGIAHDQTQVDVDRRRDTYTCETRSAHTHPHLHPHPHPRTYMYMCTPACGG